MIQVIVWLGIHIGIAQILKMSKLFSTIHALIAIGVCVVVAFDRRHPEKTVYALAYLSGAEVLWRMTKVSLFWEFGKYAIMLVCIASILTRGARQFGIVFTFILCFIPSIFILPFDTMEWVVLRKEISFALSGPISLALAVTCLAKIRLTSEQLQKAFISFLGPITGILSIAAMGAYSAREMFKYETESSAIGSGGFGPNQVAAVLGMGAVFAFFYILENKNKRYVRMMMVPLGLILATQCALTFSRGGLYCAVIAALLIVKEMVQSKRLRSRIIFSSILVFTAANLIALPALVKFTGGAITERFKDTSMSARESIFQDDINVFLNHPILGVGPSQAKYSRDITGYVIASHSEFSRALAEHGLLGVVSQALLVIMAFGAYRRAKSPPGKALAASMTAWVLVHMIVYATRNVLPSFAFGLAFVHLMPAMPMTRLNQDKHDNSPEQALPPK